MSDKKKKEFKKELAPKPQSQACRLKSKLNFPVELSYGGMGMMVPAHGRLLIKDKRKLGAVPRGVVILPA